MLRNLSIGFRSALAFGVIGVLVVIVGVAGLYSQSQLANEFNLIVDHRSPALTAIKEIETQFFKLRLENANILQAPEQSRSGFMAKYGEAQTQLDHALSVMTSLAQAEQAKKLIGLISKDIDAFYRIQKQQVAFLAQGHNDQANAMQNGEMKKLREGAAELIDDLQNFQIQRINDSKTTAKNVITRSQWVITAILLLAVVCVVVFASVFTRMLVGPMTVVVKAAEGIARGELNQVIHDNAKDETGVMLRTLDSMQTLLRETISEIQGSARQLARTAEELSVVTNHSTHSIDSQNQQLEQAASAITELTSSIEEVARNADETSNDAGDSDALAIEGHQKFENSSNMVSGLLKELESNVSGLDTLAGNIKNIGSVLDVIREIAEQTNLLALNAAIEAARAGESGRGFAVVADEVRALARRTQESTEEIEQMIQVLQAGSSEMVASIDKSFNAAKNTQSVAQEAGEALIQISASISRIKDKTFTVATATEEQAQVSKEVDHNILKIKELSTDIAAGANQTRMSSAELAKLAETMRSVADRFTV